MAGSEKKSRVHQWGDSHSVFDPRTGRLHVHKGDRRKSAEQQYVFESSQGICSTLTAFHRLKFWDLRRHATDRELARIQGFPEGFEIPIYGSIKLFGGAVSVPVAQYAIECVLKNAHTQPETFVDICAGIGGFHVAAAAHGLRCVGASEICTAALTNYARNFPTTPLLGCLYTAAWPKCDMILMGFPCQSFSRCMQTLERGAHSTRNVWQQLEEILDETEASFLVRYSSLGCLSFKQFRSCCHAVLSLWRGRYSIQKTLDFHRIANGGI